MTFFLAKKDIFMIYWLQSMSCIWKYHYQGSVHTQRKFFVSLIFTETWLVHLIILKPNLLNSHLNWQVMLKQLAEEQRKSLLWLSHLPSKCYMNPIMSTESRFFIVVRKGTWSVTKELRNHLPGKMSKTFTTPQTKDNNWNVLILVHSLIYPFFSNFYKVFDTLS